MHVVCRFGQLFRQRPELRNLNIVGISAGSQIGNRGTHIAQVVVEFAELGVYGADVAYIGCKSFIYAIFGGIQVCIEVIYRA